MSSIVSIGNYGNYSSDNYGSSRRVTIGDLDLYFSYKTVVAFQDGKTNGTVVSENAWGPTTGKHLNWIDGGNKKSRLKREDFKNELEKCLKRHKLAVN